ncbi:zinc-binding alcohol dehydrogenase family protein [Acinetobacter puyangensis]|uniref:zinc-binding alcohol dehydrogenase family protein n=1 Tax=Acinetobacter puyangensis TaxID=1096779 RepID=UPI003A4D758C
MKVVAYQQNGSIDRDDALVDIEIAEPLIQPRDLLVEVKAISVNPVDYKIRQNVAADAGQWKILGWDAAGIVRAVGDQVQNFKVGDEVWYAGAINRQGSNAQLQAVDERIVAHKPKSLNFAHSAALPLTAITAWEMLFERLQVQSPIYQNNDPSHDQNKPSILIIGAAGGVGSIAIQLLKAKTNLKIIATASRPETEAWVKQLGADFVINHQHAMPEQIKQQGLDAPQFVFSTSHSQQYLSQIAELIAPQGRLGVIDDPDSFDINVLKRKSISVHWEMMFTRSLFTTPDIQKQGDLLQSLAELVDQGVIQTTVTEIYGTINAANLKAVHALLEQGRVKGKIVLEGF